MNARSRFYVALALWSLGVFTACNNAQAAEQYRFWEYSSPYHFKAPKEGCDWLYSTVSAGLSELYMPEHNAYDWTVSNGIYKCARWSNNYLGYEFWGTLYYGSQDCATGTYYSPLQGGTCQPLGGEGIPRQELSCAALQGNPINILSGEKVQYEQDVRLGNQGYLRIGRYYNSASGRWTHSYSDHLLLYDGIVDVIMADGYVDHMRYLDGQYVSATATGTLEQSGDNWLYREKSGNMYTFNKIGQLARVQSVEGGDIEIRYGTNENYLNFILTSNDGGTATATEDDYHQLLSVSSSAVAITYTYASSNGPILSTVDYTRNGQATTKRYLYDANPKLLTGIVNEAGVREATWQYDQNARGISSEHAGGSNKTLIRYADDGNSVSVTNELGKVTTYRFVVVNGIKRIAAIEGEPTANCPASNSRFTYNTEGLVASKTDAKGSVTNYTYDSLGREVSRAEAVGTPAARTVTTEWNSVRFLPVRTIEAGRETRYEYDDLGRETGRTIAPY